MKYLIIGNSAAAVGCVEGIRQIDKNGKITIVSKEKQHTYSRPLISYLLLGKTDEQKMKYRPDSFYSDNNCEFIAGKAVVTIDAKKKSVILDDKSELSYDKLLYAAGSVPFVPPFSGLDKVKKKFSFMSLDDAKALSKELKKNSKVLIIGAGLIGLKCAEGISGKVSDITVVDLADRILPSILDEEGSKIVKSHIEKSGVKFNLADSVEEFTENSAKLKSGKIIDFDICVIAVGVRANTSILTEAGSEANRGIMTDTLCRTSLPDIFAAGDCATSFDVCTGENRVLALLPNAYMQGECAGINMAGGNKEYDFAIPMNAIGFFGLHMITAGSYDGEAHIKSGVASYKKLVTKDNTLKGYILIGDIDRAGIYTSLIRKKTPLDSIDFDLIFEKPQLMSFSKNDREVMLSGKKA